MVIIVVIKIVVIVVVVVGIADATSHALYICRTSSKSIKLIPINGKGFRRNTTVVASSWCSTTVRHVVIIDVVHYYNVCSRCCMMLKSFCYQGII